MIAGLEHAVEFDQLGARHRDLERLDGLHRRRRAAGDHDPQRRQVALRERRRVEDGDDRRRRGRDVGDLLLLDQVEHALGREAFHQHDAGAGHHRLHQRHVAPVEPHRQVVEQHLALGDGKLRVEGLAGEQRRLEAVQHALGIAGGARREAHPHHVERRHVNAVLRRDLGRAVDHLREARHVRRRDVVDADHERQFGELRPQVADHRKVVEALELRGADVGLRLREAQDVLDLGGAEVGADLVGDGADQLQREEDDRELDPVGELQRHDVAARDALPAQELRKALDLDPQLPVGDPPPRVAHRLAVWRLTRALFQHLGEGLALPPALRPVVLDVLRGGRTGYVDHDGLLGFEYAAAAKRRGGRRQRTARSRPPSTWIAVPVM